MHVVDLLAVQSSVMGASLTIPISQGRLALGTWQGIYLNEACHNYTPLTRLCSKPDQSVNAFPLNAHQINCIQAACVM